MGKHAYLVMAHNQLDLLKVLIQCLDYEENDIYIHLDKKWKNIDYNEIYSAANKSKIVVIKERVNVKWGTYSQIACEMCLLENAVSEHYQYYHLMSGMDLPLKSQKEIHDFFDKKNGTEFVHFDSPKIDKETYNRIAKYNFWIFKSSNYFEKILYYISMKLQSKIDLGKKYDVVFQKGANWFSVTDDLARYIVNNKDLIHQIFRFSRCGDEMFLQTLVANSNFKNKVTEHNYCNNYATIQYCIDWKRGSPYVFRISDFELLINSGMCFARKFDANIDKDIINKIRDYVTK